MTTIRVGKRRRWTSIDRAVLNDRRLSFRARGVLAWLLDKPDDWHCTSDSIAATGKEGRDAIRTALNELVTCGYLERHNWRSVDNGQWCSEWIVHESPKGREAGSGNQRWLPAAENQALLLNTDTETDSRSSDVALWKTQADPSCFNCHGDGIAYHPGAGRESRCDCTKTYAKTERDA